MNIQAVLAAHGFIFTYKRAIKWRLIDGAGTIKNLPSFGTCHAIATDGVHMIVHHGNGKDVIEVHQTNWIKDEPAGAKTIAPRAQNQVDKTAVLLTNLMADLE